ncbi:MAG: hypothetical protein HDT28_04815 [Clostridiales bacterium]|nr:hypothetical protein [Clostridiales bacterium]
MTLEFEEIASLCEDRELFGRVVSNATYTPQEAARIGVAYLQIFKKQIVQTCGNCVGDALSELVALYRKNPERMKEQNTCKYQLRAGMLIRLHFGDNVYYSNANLTDKVAEEYIMAKPSRLSNFSKYPESIVKKIEAGQPAPESEEVTEPATEPVAAKTRKTGAAKTGNKTTTNRGGRKGKTAKPAPESEEVTEPATEPVAEPTDGEAPAPETEREEPQA